MHEWHQRIADTKSVDKLLGLVRDYLATWRPENLAKVPEGCRPDRVKGVDDLYFWRDRLLETYCTGAAMDDSESLIRELLGFFAAAGDRAYVLRDSFDSMQTIPPLFSDNSIPRLFTSAQAGSNND